MLNTKETLYRIKSRFIPMEYSEEFFTKINVLNIKREKVLCYILIIINIILLFLDKFLVNISNLKKHIFLPYSKIHAMMLLLPLIFLIGNHIKEKIIPNNYIVSKGLHLSINAIVLLICSIIGTDNVLNGQQPYAYIIAMFCIASLLILSPYERVIIYIIPYAVYIIKVIKTLEDINYLIGVIFFLTLLSAISLLVSNINYTSYLRNFINKKIIIKKNHQLDKMYKKAEDALITRTKELNEVKEYEELRTAFFANISHELRTPLNLIFSCEQVIRQNLNEIKHFEKGKEITKYMDIMKNNSYRLIRLVNNLIDATKIDAGYLNIKLRECDIVRVVEEVCMSVAKYIENKHVELTFDTEIEERIMLCDPDKIERIILNLLSNAIKFTTKKGSIYVNMYEENENIIISVKDTGIGIPIEMKDLIFEKFIQVDKSSTRSTEGSGIGLAIVKSFVDMHNGKIEVNSHKGKGSEFIIYIPTRIQSEHESIKEEYVYTENHIIDKINIEFSDIYY